MRVRFRRADESKVPQSRGRDLSNLNYPSITNRCFNRPLIGKRFIPNSYVPSPPVQLPSSGQPPPSAYPYPSEQLYLGSFIHLDQKKKKELLFCNSSLHLGSPLHSDLLKKKEPPLYTEQLYREPHWINSLAFIPQYHRLRTHYLYQWLKYPTLVQDATPAHLTKAPTYLGRERE